ncbi:MAG TPA: EAL domain-containing protein [Acidimicrobiales bacterium]|nr:EAL domain-containing protein [Acidimicrobiales bacterium]
MAVRTPTVVTSPDVPANDRPQRARGRVAPPPPAGAPRRVAGSRALQRLRSCAAAAPAQFWSQLVTAVVVVAYTASTVLVARPPSGYDSLWDGWIGNLASILPLVPIGLRIASTKRFRGAWIAMATGIALYDAGNLIYLWHDQNLNPIPSPAPSDAAYLAAYVCFAVGVAMLTQRNFGAVAMSTRLDGAITGLAIGATAGMLWFDRVLSVSGKPLEVAVGMAYPLMDLVILVLLFSALAPLRYRPGRSTLLLMAGVGFFVVGDVVYLNQLAAGSYVQGTLLDTSWVIGIWLMGLAAWPRQERRAVARVGDSTVPTGFTHIPIVFGTLSVLVLAATLVHHTSRIASLMALAALGLVIVRMAMTLGAVRDAEKDNFRVARIDELTGLSNRRAFFEDGEERFADRRPDQRLGVVVIDLDGFKEINDTLGHAAGDELLRVVSRRFASRTDGRGQIARIGGDEFAGTFEIGSVPEIIAIAQDVAAIFTDPVSIDGMTVRVGGSIGVALCPDHGLSQADLLRCADVAMYEAKGEQMPIRLYRPEDDVHTRDRLTLIDDLRTTPWERELILHFQPTLDLRSGELLGVEALVRWRHPEFGLLYPADFVPLCERIGMIRTLTRRVIELAVAELARLDRGGRSLQMSVNISRLDLLDDELPGYVDVVLAQHGVSPERLTMEVTETAISKDPAHAASSIVHLRERGVRISIDDFGVGYSSLSQLLELPVDELKIDKSFVLALGVDARARAVVTATIELARALGLTVVAEGIESSTSLRAVTELGVDVAQGYFVACPYTSAQLDAFLATQPSSSTAR